MIREDYLITATRGNLFGLSMLRDSAAILQSGVRAGETFDLLTLERIKCAAEALLARSIILSDGFVSESGDSLFLTSATQNVQARMTVLGIQMNTTLVAQCRQVLKSGALPPVGMRGTLYDAQRDLSKDAHQIAAQLAEWTADTAHKQSEGKKQSGFSLKVLESFKSICSDYAVSAKAYAGGEGDAFCIRVETVAALRVQAEKSIDVSEAELLNWLNDVTKNDMLALARLSGAAGAGAVQSTLPPLYFDFAFRCALSAASIQGMDK